MILLAALLSVSYVAAIRVLVPPEIGHLSRDDERVIRYRIRRVTVLCLAILLGLPLLLSFHRGASYGSVVRQFGIIPGYSKSGNLGLDLLNIVVVIAKVLVLYMGPIAHYVYTHKWDQMADDVRESFWTLQGFRSHVFAPITEEFVFRAAVMSVLHPEFSRSAIMKLTPALFGIAHAHHGYTRYFHEGDSIGSVVVAVLFQFAYTTAFGWLSNKTYFDTQFNFWATVALHCMCNVFGFPEVDWRKEHPRWFIVYCVMLFVGACTFWKML